MGKITVEVKINTFGTMLYSLNHPNGYLHTYLLKMRSLSLSLSRWSVHLAGNFVSVFFCFYAFSSSTRFKLGHQTLFYFTNFALIINKFLNDERTVKSIWKNKYYIYFKIEIFLSLFNWGWILLRANIVVQGRWTLSSTLLAYYLLLLFLYKLDGSYSKKHGEFILGSYFFYWPIFSPILFFLQSMNLLNSYKLKLNCSDQPRCYINLNSKYYAFIF